MAQTAVEWLVRELNQELNYIPIAQWDRIRDIVQRAKEMEKEQIMDAYDKGESPFADNGKYLHGIDYYNQSYG